MNLVMECLPHQHQLVCWLALYHSPECSTAQLISLSQRYPTFDLLWKFGQKLLGQISPAVSDKLHQDLAWLNENTQHHIITIFDPLYPDKLKQIAAPPPLLYIKGSASLLTTLQLALVGSRNPTINGKEAAYSFAYHLAQSGFTITSGLARGIDGQSHLGALAAAGKTIAVAGTGLRQVYPKQHQALEQQIIAAGGAVVSEFPLNTLPIAGNFPRRNRIISGLSVGVLVVEAALRSGSLITARTAMEQGREVFAIPGTIHNPLARGCHHLIKQGAKLVESYADIAQELGQHCLPQLPQLSENETKNNFVARKNDSGQKHTAVAAQLTARQCLIYQALGDGVAAVDTLVNRTQLSSAELMCELSLMELDGLLLKQAGGYIKIHDAILSTVEQ